MPSSKAPTIRLTSSHSVYVKIYNPQSAIASRFQEPSKYATQHPFELKATFTSLPVGIA